MFKSQNKSLDKIVTCAVCNQFLLEPVVLPCKSSICKMHVYEKTKADETLTVYKCQVCLKDHKIPEDGFLSNETIVEMMALNLHLNEKLLSYLLTG